MRKILEERLENARNDWLLDKRDYLRGQMIAYRDCLNLMQPRTEQEILDDFEALGYRVKNDNDVLRLKNNFIEIYVYKQEQEYGKEDVFSCEANRFTMQEHKLLNELFECYGFLEVLKDE